MHKSKFDFIIAGAGAAGLSLLVRMIKSGKFADSQILLVDRVTKNVNDRTWCFWEEGAGLFEDIIYKSWPAISIHNYGFSKTIDIFPYRYKMIRGIDFYNYCFSLIYSQPNITVAYGNVSRVELKDNLPSLRLDDEEISATFIFSSIISGRSIEAKGKHNLLQHFTGWTINTDRDVFDENSATLMDFRMPQTNGCSFVYIMPFSARSALVEYTIFGKEVLPEAEYASAIKVYLEAQYPGMKYEVTSSEYGVIPMTDYEFPERSGNIINIGTAGGQTKPSSGYTFQFIQKRTAEIVDKLSGNPQLRRLSSIPLKYSFYDRVLLNVLATGKQQGSDVFTRLFQKNPPARIFRFLDNESSLIDDLSLISTLPVLPFLKASVE